MLKNKSRKNANISGISKCQICNTQTFLVTHHLNGRNIPDANHPSNLADLCDSCHRSVHMGAIIIEGWFTTTDGLQLLWHKKDEEGITGNDIVPHIITHR